MEFMRKYLYIAKCVVPVLTDEAAREIAEEYAALRSQDLVDDDVARVSSSLET
jgi:DNA replicative helicase MCM subunit Mcm2 (Cdc46/Mcm family)